MFAIDMSKGYATQLPVIADIVVLLEDKITPISMPPRGSPV